MPNLFKKTPWTWVPTLYFAEGIPYVMAMSVAVIMYKRFGISNVDIALYTSWLYLPWVIKPFWSPFVDMMKTKRWWVITMQLLIGAGLAGVAFLIPMPFFFQATLAVLWLIAFSSATHDIAADGFYMLALDSSQQSFFVGIRSTFYRLAMITGQGLLIIIAGSLESFTGLQPMQFTVESSNTVQTQVVLHPQNYQVPKTDELTFVAFPSYLVLNTNTISPDSLAKIKKFVFTENQRNGFVSSDAVSTGQSNKGADSWWTKHVSSPLGHFIKINFGQEKKNVLASDGKAGNAGIVAVRLTKQPERGKTVVLNSSFSKGDKSVSLVSGERFVFTADNWDKPAYIVVQLDYKLKDRISTQFKGISGNIKLAWSITFFILAGFFILLSFYHRFVLPRPLSDHSTEANSVGAIFREFGHTFATFFQKPGVVLAILFMLSYRLGEAMLVKMVSPFLLDAREAGGLGLTTGQVGLVYGTVGVVALTLGGITGGIAASRKGLKYWIWPMAMSITLPQCSYIFLSTFTPDNLFFINLAVAVEQFGYGFGFTAYMLYMIYFADGEHKTAHYAICTAFMALGMMLPGMIAGWLQELLGYQHYFIAVMLAIIPCYLIVSLLKIDPKFGMKSSSKPLK
jgi:PAT family beta-lactamase induction signal transducer AmpG